jgi:hypothetical protein
MGSTKMCLGITTQSLDRQKCSQVKKSSAACNNNHVHIYNIATPWGIGTKYHYVNNENKCQDANSAYPMGMTCKLHLHHGA